MLVAEVAKNSVESCDDVRYVFSWPAQISCILFPKTKADLVLNETLEFADAPFDVRRAFSGRVTKMRLVSGHQLYKFTDRGLFQAGNVTPWWSSVKPINSEDTGLDNFIERTESLDVPADQFARARNAVTAEWNGMDDLLTARLLTAVFGFAGRAAHQNINQRTADANVVFIGGAIQLWIPNLKRQHIQMLSREPQ